MLSMVDHMLETNSLCRVLIGNQLTEAIPESFSNITSLTEIDLSSNILTGSPDKLFSIPFFNLTIICERCLVAITVTSIAAFSLLIEVVLGYRYHRFRKKNHDVFYDVPGEDFT